MITSIWNLLPSWKTTTLTTSETNLERDVRQKRQRASHQGPSLAKLAKATALMYLASGRNVLAEGLPTKSSTLQSTCTRLPCEIDFLCKPVVAFKGLNDIGVRVGHASQVYIAEFSDGDKAIFKPQDDLKYGESKYEVAAYRLSELFGLGLVPPTEYRELKVGSQHRDGSLQQLVDGSHPYDGWNANEYPNLMFLDLVLANGDRHRENVLVERTGVIHAIDNNKSFRPFDKWAEPKILERLKTTSQDYLVDPLTFAKIKSISKEKFVQTLDCLVAPQFIEDAWKRLELFKAIIEPHVTARPEWSILTNASARSHYEKELKLGAIASIKPLADVNSESSKMSLSGAEVYIVEYQSGVRGVFKRDLQGSVGTYKHEIAAYKLAELLDYHHVPPVVERVVNLNGLEIKGSVQLFVPGGKHLFPEKIHYRDFDRPRDLRYFDFALGIHKRHNGNYLIGNVDESVYFAIDHANTFTKKNDQRILVESWKNIVADLTPQSPHLKRRLKTITREQISEALDGLVSKPAIGLVIDRLTALRDAQSGTVRNLKSPDKA